MVTPKAAFNPIKSQRTFEKISVRIKKLIFDGVFKPADKLSPEAELTRQFNISRQSIRKAWRILEFSGFTTIQNSDGCRAILEDTISNTSSQLMRESEFLDNEKWHSENIIKSNNIPVYH